MSIRTFLLILLTSSTAFAQDKGLFLVTRDYRIRPFPEAATIVVDWKELQNHRSIPESGDFDITDGNFGKNINKSVVDSNSDGQPDHVVIEYVFRSDEAIYSFATRPNGKPLSLSTSKATPDTRLKVTYLSKRIDLTSDDIIRSVMSLNPEPTGFNSDFAYFLTAVFKQWQESKNDAYYNYIKKWADRLIDSHGYLDPKYYNVADYELEDLLPGRIFISLYEVTKDQKYKGAAQQLRQQLQYQPRTSDGGYWHRQASPFQMWLDGAYMADVFLMQYAKTFNEPKMFEEAMQQIELVHEHNTDPDTGLLYHGWDESINNAWANEDTGTSPEFWSRGIAWYYTALLESIDYIPLESPDRKVLGQMFRDLTKPVRKFEDPKTALWFQVINKSYEPRNWFETSASAMFAYCFAKGFNKGILDKSYLASAQKTFVSLQKEYIFFDADGRVYLDGAVKNSKQGDLDNYLTAEKRVNDYKGLGALLYLSMELD